MTKRNFLATLLALPAQAIRAQKGRTFLQLNIYERIPEKVLPAYFAAIDREYIPAMLKAPGLVSYQRFRHYDLPEKVAVEIWESEEAAKAWHDGERARAIWKRAMEGMPRGVGMEHKEPMHSMVHRHYILE